MYSTEKDQYVFTVGSVEYEALTQITQNWLKPTPFYSKFKVDSTWKQQEMERVNLQD